MSEKSEPVSNYDVVIIGAGLSAMYAIYKLRQLGMSMKAFEAAGDLGGTWYWNRYPGCRFDSESYTYGYGFSRELLDEWDWSENFAAQPETLRYLNYVADKFDLRRDIQFNARVTKAHWDETENLWRTTLADGTRVNSSFLITCVGVLSEPNIPKFEGADSFRGMRWHTARWPHEDIDFSGKRIGIIGSGATAVQLTTALSKVAGQLTVFQRSPNYCAPLHNSPIDPQSQRWIKQHYPEILDRCNQTFGAFLYDFDPRSALELSDEEFREVMEELWAQPGFGIWLGNFHDMITNREANDRISEFVREKIREQIDDPETARKLVPTSHGFGVRRVPLESGYYSCFNQENVELVALPEEPIERFTGTGIQTSRRHIALDAILYATGFDAVTGAFMHIDIRGQNGELLKDKWRDGPRTYLGMQVAGFPNMFMVLGPHNGGNFCNIPRCSEQNVEWVVRAIAYLRERGATRMTAEPAAEAAWTEHVYEVINQTLIPQTDSWFNGSNVEGKARTFLMYAGGAPAYRQRCDEVSANDYEGFLIE